MDRTINWGDDAADARYRTQDTSSTGGDFVLAEDLDGGTVLLEYDYSASEWVSRGPVNLTGNDITNAGSITADSLEADEAQINSTYVKTVPSGQSGLSSGTFHTVDYKNPDKDILGEFDESNDDFVPQNNEPTTAIYRFVVSLQIGNGSAGDRIIFQIYNETTSSVVDGDLTFLDSGASDEIHQFVYDAKLTDGETYSIRYKNENSTSTIRDGQLTIRRRFI